jgi:hypothetical protein
LTKPNSVTGNFLGDRRSQVLYVGAIARIDDVERRRRPRCRIQRFRDGQEIVRTLSVGKFADCQHDKLVWANPMRLPESLAQLSPIVGGCSVVRLVDRERRAKESPTINSIMGVIGLVVVAGRQKALILTQ